MHVAMAALALLFGAGPTTRPAVSASVIPGDRAEVLDRQTDQLGGRWTVRWRVRWLGPDDLVLDASRVKVDYQGTVSNPECPGHGLPRPTRTQFVLSDRAKPDAGAKVIVSPNRDKRCVERLDVTAQVEGGPAWDPDGAALHVRPGQVLVVGLAIRHVHPVYGPWVPLLGARQVALTLGELRLGDRVDLSRAINTRVPPSTWTPPKPIWHDATVYRSPPHSWAVFPGKEGGNVLTLTDIPVRFATRYELVFWARVDTDKPHRFQVHVRQMQATPNRYVNIPGDQVLALPSDDRWHRQRMVWINSPRTNRVMIQFKFLGDQSGGAWVDDMSLRALPQPRRAP